VPYLFAAKGLFKIVSTSAPAPVPTPAPTPTPTPPPNPPASAIVTACDGVRLRTSAAVSATVTASINAGTVIGVASTVAGGAWSATCGGVTASGTDWYRINAIGTNSVSSLFGVSYLYAATGLFKIVSPPPGPGPTLTEGIDVSHWQGAIDWVKVRGAGKRFAFMKASESTGFVDSTYAQNRANANAVGIIVGAYHFARPDGGPGDAVAEADHFVATGRFARGDLLPVLDLEVSGGLSQPALVSWVQTFMARVYERTGARGVIYVSPSFWKNYMGDTTLFATSGYKVLWIAHWTTSSAPLTPAANWGSHGWTFWQYTSSGSVPGIAGRVDLNRYQGTDFRPVQIP
jgi:GH25 family lysozyme M1 (1,4-beta-N-acetylmuramidase)